MLLVLLLLHLVLSVLLPGVHPGAPSAKKNQKKVIFDTHH